MARLLALEWNDTEARLAVASSRGEQVIIEQAFSVALSPPQPDTDQAAIDLSERIAAALAARGLGRMDTLVAVGRTNIELRRLSVPPAPDDELPELVRFQALREFTTFNEQWPLDFLPIDDTPEQSRTVLAAAIDPALVERIQETCRSAGLKPRRLILRPCAAASLLGRSQAAAPAEVRLLVDLLVDEADLTVIVDRKVVYLRTARLPGDPLSEATPTQALLSEIRRTIAAAQNQLGGRPVESIVLCGADEQHEELAEWLGEQLSLPAELFDPFGGLRLGSELRRGLPDQPGRFAPLLGALLDEFLQTPHAIDFLHPRRRPQAPGRRNTYALAGLAAATVVLAVFWYGWFQSGSLDREIRRLRLETTGLQKKITALSQEKKAADAIQKWASTEVVWLDELHWLVEKFPPAQEAMLTQLQLASGIDGGEMTMDGVVRNVETVKTMENNLRDDSHYLVGRDKGRQRSEEPYSIRFTSSLYVKREEQ